MTSHVRFVKYFAYMVKKGRRQKINKVETGVWDSVFELR